MMIRSLRLALAALVLGSGIALAGANHIPHWSFDTDEEAAKSIKTFGFTTEGKAATWPKKIAIPYFVVRFDQTAVEGDSSVTTVKFPSSDYTMLTDALYDQIVKRYTDAGFEVVPKATVIAAKSYAALEGETGGDEGEQRFKGVPTGMKLLPTMAGKPKKENDLAALNKELGTDAVVAVWANFGICPVDMTPDTRMAGTKPCLKGNLTLPGLSLLFVGGAEGEGSSIKPTWTSRAFKEVVIFSYQDSKLQTTGERAEAYDAALISPLSAVDWNKKNFWGNQTGDAEVGAYAQGVSNMLDVGFIMAMETFYDKNSAAMTAAGVKRPARPAAPEGSRLATGKEVNEQLKDMKAQTAQMSADLEKQKAELAARPEGAPVASGTVLCFEAPVAGAAPATVLKRGYEAGRVVDETVSSVPNFGPVQAVTIYTLGEGTYTVTDTKNSYSGSGTFVAGSPGWSSWTGTLTFAGNVTANVNGTADAAGMHVVTVVKGADGATLTSFDQQYKTLDAATCQTRWTTFANTPAAPPLVPGTGVSTDSGKKKKK